VQESRLAAVKYCDGDVLITLVAKDFDSPFVFILPPLGDRSVFVERLHCLSEEVRCSTAKRPILRKVNDELANDLLLSDCFCEVPPSSFTHARDYPEDVYPQVIVATGDGAAMLGGHFQRTRNHLNYLRRHHSVVANDITPTGAADVVDVVRQWTAQHAMRMMQQDITVGTSVDATAYTVFSDSFATRVDNLNYFGRVLYVDGHATGFAFAGRTGPESAALYSSLCLLGARGCSEFLIMDLMRELRMSGIAFLNLGGSETEGLFNFKSKFGSVARRRSRELEYLGTS